MHRYEVIALMVEGLCLDTHLDPECRAQAESLDQLVRRRLQVITHAAGTTTGSLWPGFDC